MIKKLLLTICFCFIATVASADHWVYIRLEDRLGVTAADNPGRSKEGDIVDIRFADYELSERELAEYAIVRVIGLTAEIIAEYKQVWEEEGFDEFGEPIKIPKAYRKYKLKKQWLKYVTVGLYPDTINVSIIDGNIELKTEQDLVLYEKKRKVYAFFRPFRITYGYVEYAFEYWTLPAYALTEAACGSATADREVVCTINKSGQDYDTLTLWEDAVDGDLVTDQQIQRADCYDDDGDLVDNLVADGSTTNSSYYMKITAPESERHNGTDDGSFTLAPSSGDTLLASDSYMIIEWLIIDGANAVNDSRGIKGETGGDFSTYRNNIIIGNGSTSGIKRGITCSSSTRVYNNIIMNVAYGCDYSIYSNCAYQTYNNTIYNLSKGYVGIFDAGGEVKNNIVVGAFSLGDFYTYDSDASSDYNISSDTTANNTNDTASVSAGDLFVSITPGSEDLHLKSGATAIDDGVDLGTTPSGVQFDIDNDDRDTLAVTWDIGADEYVAAGGATFIPRVIMY